MARTTPAARRAEARYRRSRRTESPYLLVSAWPLTVRLRRLHRAGLGDSVLGRLLGLPKQRLEELRSGRQRFIHAWRYDALAAALFPDLVGTGRLKHADREWAPGSAAGRPAR